jgi:Kef-type K+ transport system membrane component KefB
MHGNILYVIGLSIMVATALAYGTRLAKQPLLLAYIAAGLLLGPQGLGWIREYEDIATLSELGLAFLLFIVGLEIDLKKLVTLGKISVITGLIQLCFSVVAGIVFVRWLGFEGLPATYLAVALAFSSTMIVIKLLSDKAELDTIHGRITLSVLLIQDIVAIIVLALQTDIADPSVLKTGVSLLYGLGLAAGSVLVARFLLPRLFTFAAQSPELLLISSLSWCFVVCGAAIAADFSIAMGALIAGVSISSFPYNVDVIAKVRSLRDFFVTLFFISLGMQINVTSGSILVNGLLLSAFIIASRWLTILPPLYFLKFGTRVGILSSMNLAQASEFSLVIAAIGFKLGHISQDVVSLIAIALVITSTVSTYMISANHRITKVLVHLLSAIGLKDQTAEEEKAQREGTYDVVLLGFHRVAASLIPSLSEKGRSYLAVDFNPETLTKLRESNIPCVYADISHIDSLEHIGLEHARVIISSISNDFLRETDNAGIVRAIRKLNPEAFVVGSADTTKDALNIYRAGANYVVLPRHLAADHLSAVLDDVLSEEVGDVSSEHLTSLQQRFEIL